MALFTLSGSENRRCETTVVAIDGACVACGCGAGQICDEQRRRRERMGRRARLAQLDRIRLDGSVLIPFPDAAWF